MDFIKTFGHLWKKTYPLLLLLIVFGFTILSAQNQDSLKNRGVTLTVVPDKETFALGENIGFTIVVENTGTTNATVSFPTTCWFDYLIDYSYQYLYGMFCNTLYFEYDLLPGQTLQESFAHTPAQYGLSPGQHEITGILNGSPYTQGSAMVWVSETSEQIIELTPGWNLISLCKTPGNTSPEAIFSAANLSCTLEMLTGFHNQEGQFYDPNGQPFLNTLTEIIAGEGYWTKVAEAGTLTIEGISFPEDFTIDLVPGWNLMGYWPQETQTPEDTFTDLITAGILQMVSGYEQGGLFFDPNGFPPLNTLTEIKTGFGYWIKVNGNCTLIYPE